MNNYQPSNSRGFTIIELLIVLAILVILTAIAIPTLRGARAAYRERSVVKYLAQIGSAANSYKTNSGYKRYPLQLQELYATQSGDAQSLIPEPEGMIDANSVTVGDWNITWSGAGGTNAFTCVAVPTDNNSQKRLAVYEDGVVRMTTDGSIPSRTSQAAR